MEKITRESILLMLRILEDRLRRLLKIEKTREDYLAYLAVHGAIKWIQRAQRLKTTNTQEPL